MTYIYCNIMTLKRVLLIFSYARMVELHGAINSKWNDFLWSREWKYRFEGTFTILKCDFREITIDLHTKINALHCPWSRDRVCCTLKYLCTLKSRPRESLESWVQVWSGRILGSSVPGAPYFRRDRCQLLNIRCAADIRGDETGR